MKTIMLIVMALSAWLMFTRQIRAEGKALMEILYTSSADQSKQPAMFYAPAGKESVPLVVALHTWGGDYKQKYHNAIAQWCMQNEWAFIHPDFRGPNIRPEATGSELAVKDIVSAVTYACETSRIDRAAIYLVGTSGGGYAALLMAGRHPELWAGVSAWVPLSDLKAWYFECLKAHSGYAKQIVKSCGGEPGASPAVDQEYRKRSPLTYLANARELRLHINAGINDGHTGSIPISHSLRAFNEVADSQDRLSEDDIRFFVEKAEAPPRLKANIFDPSYGKKQPLFRRISGNATVTIFNGGHELVPGAALAWIQEVHKNKISAEITEPATRSSR